MDTAEKKRRRNKRRTARAVKKSAVIVAIAVVVSIIIGSCVRTSASEDDSKEEEPQTVTEATETTETTTDPNVSKNGYKIENINGVTYVDGVLLANKKYSLPREYIPATQVSAGANVTQETYDAYKEMNAAANKAGINIDILSGYRSYDDQKKLHDEYISELGVEEANKISSPEGYSEHQTGLTLDVCAVTTELENWEEGKWLKEHCYEYGFIIRYEKDKEDKTGYSYEPWHIRYVGKDLAKKLHDSNMCLEEYFGLDAY